MSEIANKTAIGAFALQITQIGHFVVTGFQLTKSVNKIAACTISIADFTQQITVNNLYAYPKELGSIKELFKKTQQIQNTGKLYSCRLIEYKKDSTKVWFTGKLCVITPILQTAYGIQSSLQCYCLGQACQLLFQPFTDFIYVPEGFASDPGFLQRVGAFEPGGIVQAMFASSKKPSVDQIVSSGKIAKTDTILQMLSKALTALLKWNKVSPQNIQFSNKFQAVDLTRYFECNLVLSDPVKNSAASGQLHPYVKSLVDNFINGFQHDNIMQAVMSTLSSSGRYLSFAPSSISSQKDMLQIIPAYVQPYKGQGGVSPYQMLGCSLSVNPLEHIKTPTYLYIRNKKGSAWESISGQKDIYDKTLGSYQLKGATAPFRLQILDVECRVIDRCGRHCWKGKSVIAPIHQK